MADSQNDVRIARDMAESIKAGRDGRGLLRPIPRHKTEAAAMTIAVGLAAGMIAATGREHTAAEAVAVYDSVLAELKDR